MASDKSVEKSEVLPDLAAKLDAEFAAIKQSEIDGNRGIVEKAIAISQSGRSQGHGTRKAYGAQ
jgi:hypothetical protein